MTLIGIVLLILTGVFFCLGLAMQPLRSGVNLLISIGLTIIIMTGFALILGQ